MGVTIGEAQAWCNELARAFTLRLAVARFFLPRSVAPLFTYPDFDPVAFSIGPLAVRWYGVMYLGAFLLTWLGLRSRAKLPWSKVGPAQVDDVVFYGALGAIVGGRIGYMLIYGLGELVADPLSLFTVWKGGMSFHGGLTGVLVAMALYGRRARIKFFDITDAISPWASGGIFLGRVGNFINGELWGKPTSPDAPWAVIVNGQARHASQLYEAFLEGLLLCIVLWLYTRRPRPTMGASGLFLTLYGAFRIVLEFVRVPDQQMGSGGYLALGWVTTGMLLSVPMVIAGVALLVLAYRKGADGAPAPRPAPAVVKKAG
jgi:phosphatidylglycerol:prolipoprotein diacylglycerol transferase